MTPQELHERIAGSGRAGEIDAQLKKLGFSLEFITANVLQPPAASVSRVAMLWMGMPNKHDRKRTRELFGLLTELGLLAPSGDDENWRVTL